MLKSQPPVLVNVIYLEIESADDQVKMKSLGWTLIQQNSPSMEKTFGHRDRHMWREHDVKTRGEHQLQAKEGLKLPEARKEARNRFCLIGRRSKSTL